MFAYEFFEGKKYKCTCHPGDPDPDCPEHGLEPMEVGDALDVKNEAKQRLDPKCWKGYRKAGTKMKGGVRVNNCVPANEGREHDEGDREPPNNFAIYINGKKWKVFPGLGYYADDFREQAQHRKLKDWCQKKSQATGKRWEVYVTGEPVTESNLNEKWSNKYKRSIDCSHPKGFSQRAHCAGRKKNESAELTMVCPDCGWSKEGLAEGGPFNYGAKKPRKGSVADIAAKKRHEQEKGKQPAEPKDHMVGVARVKKDVEEGLGYSQNPEQAKWYHEGRDAMKFGTHGDTMQEIAKKHGCPPEWLDAFRAGYKDQFDWNKKTVTEENKGLYYNVNKRKKAGTSRPAGHPKAPTAQAWKDAAKTAKK